MKTNRIGLTVYDCSGALKFEETVTEAGDPTLLIEATNLTTVFGWAPTFTASNHRAGNKSLILENQGGN